MDLLIQIESVLWNIALGFLISGGILVVLSVILNIESIADLLGIGDHDVSLDHDVSIDHDVSLDHDVSIDHDVSLDHDVSIDHDVSLDHDVSIDHDVSLDHDVSIDHDVDAEHDFGAEHDVSADLTDARDVVKPIQFKDITETSAPLFLLVSTYFLMFGIIGVSTLRLDTTLAGRIIRIISLFVVPYILARGISLLWRKLSRTTAIPIRKGEELVGEIATVYVSVDNKGGIIQVNLGETIGTVKLPARSFDYYKKFNRGEQVRIVAVKKHEYLVDEII